MPESLLFIASSTTILTPDGQEGTREDVLVEAPVEVALNERTIGSAMVLPRDLEAFAAGLLYGQG